MQRIIDAVKGASVLVTGPPHSQKNIFMDKLLLHCSNDNVILLATDEFPDDILNRAARALKQHPENVYCIDCFSMEHGSRRIGADPRSLTEISIAITKMLSMTRMPHVIINSVSTLMMHNSLAIVKKFLAFQMRKLKAAGATSYLIMDDSAHPQMEIGAIEALTDATLRFNNNYAMLNGVVNGKELSMVVKV